jgi:hypothetical protein
MSTAKSELKVGDRVSHPDLGEGDVLDLYPHGEELFAVISFEKWGQKKIAVGYAKLCVIELPREEEGPGGSGEGRGKKGKRAARAKAGAKAKPRTKPKAKARPKAGTKKTAKAKAAKKTKKKVKKKS